MRNCRQGVEVGEVKGSDEARPGTGSGVLCVSGGTGAWSRGEGLTWVLAEALWTLWVTGRSRETC